VSRQRIRELELSEGELVVAKSALDELHDDLYVLACAVEDVERDIADGADVRRALDWLLEAAKPLRNRKL
jgi:hypothetical protein